MTVATHAENGAKCRGNKIGYARVSTASQTTGQQVHALRRAGCTQVFVDDATSATAHSRPGLTGARNALKKGDVFVVWAIDRAFRSTRDAILFLDELIQQGVAFQSLTQQIDTRTPEGRKWYIDTASWAEYERAIISRRTKEKMAHAKRCGKHIGRPYKLDKPLVLKAHRLISVQGKDIDVVAAQCRVSPITITRAFKRYHLTD